MTSLCPLNSFSAGKVLLSSGGTFLLPRCHLYGGVTNVGQADELEGLEEKALKTGASKCYVEDLTDEFVEDYIIPTVKAGAKYEDYMLGTSFARPIIAKRIVEIAKAEGADAIAHGCTGKGNDQVRFELAMFDGIEYRGYGQEIVEELARYADVPVWNGLTNEFHPTQILADMLTIQEHFGSLKGKKLVYLGDARYNMGNSLMVGCAKLGMEFVACAPESYFPDKALVAQCMQIARVTGAKLSFETRPQQAVKGAHALYTDVWVSMGEPMEVWQKRIQELSPYCVTRELLAAAGEQTVFMHCLPAFHDLKTGIGLEMGQKFGRDCMEVTDEVFESKRSLVFDQAENRMHTIKAVMAATL